MTNTFLALINRILARTGQTEVVTLANVATPAKQAIIFLNETRKEILDAVPNNQWLKKGTLNLISGQPDYTLPAETNFNLIQKYAVTINNTALQYISPTGTFSQGEKRPAIDLDDQTPGQPRYYYSLADNQTLSVWPVPDKTETLRFYYRIAASPLINDSDLSQFSEHWETVLVLGTQARLERFLGEPYADTYALYREGITRLKRQIRYGIGHRMQGPCLGY
ncbi:MAG: hypothetical protein AAGI66_08605 [Cyanobacteria bacterium P01_H01_bin.74]